MRLIDADTLNYVRVRIYHDDGTIGGYNAVVPSSEIKNAPTVDAEPVKHGRWIATSSCDHVACSNCLKSYDWYTQAQYIIYCPKCGAKMDAERKE